jgi:hypothetical protein
MLEGIKKAHNMGFKIGIVTNSYWATSIEDAKLWLKPFSEYNISDLSVSDDFFHHEKEEDNPAKFAFQAARELGITVGSICIEEPKLVNQDDQNNNKGLAIIGGGVVFRGRAVEKLINNLPLKNVEEFTKCPFEDLENPKRVHLDSYGNVHLCQGISMGNIWETPLSSLAKNYNALKHPICGPLVKNGPLGLAQEYNVEHEENYVDACHFCYQTRLNLLEKFPEYLTPKQVYGL